MAGCVLRVGGENLDPKVLLRASALGSCLISRGPSRSSSVKRENGGFNLNVSTAGGGDLAAQARDALAFLAQHGAELRRLKSLPGVTGMDLDFGCWQKNVPAQFLRLPSELIALAGALGIGVELSLYAAG